MTVAPYILAIFGYTVALEGSPECNVLQKIRVAHFHLNALCSMLKTFSSLAKPPFFLKILFTDNASSQYFFILR